MKKHNIHVIIGKRIFDIRNSKKISQEKLANLAEIDRTYLPDVEKGNRRISVQILQRITNALGISLSDFFKDLKL